MDSEQLPHTATPEKIVDICAVLRDNPLNESEVADSMGVKPIKIQDTINYGRHLGLLSSGNEEIELVGRGHALSYMRSIDTNDIFIDIFESYSPYRFILCKIFEEDRIETILEETSITRETVENVLEDGLGLNGKDRATEGAAITFLKTLAEAGLGEYKNGRKGYSTRLEGNSKLIETGNAWAKKYEAALNTETALSLSKNSKKNPKPRDADMVSKLVDATATTSSTPIILELELSSSDWSKGDILEIIGKVHSQ